MIHTCPGCWINSLSLFLPSPPGTLSHSARARPSFPTAPRAWSRGMPHFTWRSGPWRTQRALLTGDLGVQGWAPGRFATGGSQTQPLLPVTQDCLRAWQWSRPHGPGHLQDVPAQSIRLQRLSQPCPRAAPRERPSQRPLIGAKCRRPGPAPRTRHRRCREPQGDGGPGGLGRCDGPSACCLPAGHRHCRRYRPASATGVWPP